MRHPGVEPGSAGRMQVAGRSCNTRVVRATGRFFASELSFTAADQATALVRLPGLIGLVGWSGGGGTGPATAG